MRSCLIPRCKWISSDLGVVARFNRESDRFRIVLIRRIPYFPLTLHHVSPALIFLFSLLSPFRRTFRTTHGIRTRALERLTAVRTTEGAYPHLEVHKCCRYPERQLNLSDISASTWGLALSSLCARYLHAAGAISMERQGAFERNSTEHASKMV
jgi:hypothetical protein